MLTHQQLLVRRLERLLLTFFLLAALFLLVVYVAEPSMYTQTLLLQSSPTNRYPFPVTLFLVVIVGFLSILMVGVVRHWHYGVWALGRKAPSDARVRDGAVPQAKRDQ